MQCPTIENKTFSSLRNPRVNQRAFWCEIRGRCYAVESSQKVGKENDGGKTGIKSGENVETHDFQ